MIITGCSALDECPQQRLGWSKGSRMNPITETEQHPEERRRHVRHAYEGELHYRLTALNRATAIDLSHQGASFCSDEPLDSGQEIELFLINSSVKITGEVRQRQPLADGRYRIGVEFDRAEQELIEVVIAAWNSQWP